MSEAKEFLIELEESNTQLEETNSELFLANSDLDTLNIELADKNAGLKEINIELKEENLLLEEKFQTSKLCGVEINDQLEAIRRELAGKARQLTAAQEAFEEKAAEHALRDVQVSNCR